MEHRRASRSGQACCESNDREDEGEAGDGQSDAQPRRVLVVRFREHVRCAEEKEEADVESRQSSDWTASVRSNRHAP